MIATEKSRYGVPMRVGGLVHCKPEDVVSHKAIKIPSGISCGGCIFLDEKRTLCRLHRAELRDNWEKCDPCKERPEIIVVYLNGYSYLSESTDENTRA